jgi:L-aspartate oxidase
LEIFDNTLNAEGVVIVGAGLAALYCALKLSPRPVTVLSPMPLGSGASSAWAQGGVAAAVGKGDTALAHALDTQMAGAGIVDHGTSESITAEAAARIEDLAALGIPFDRDGLGNYVLSREAAHSANRVVRVSGDRAGQAIMQALIAKVRETASIRIVEGITAVDLARADGRVVGVFCRKLGDRYVEPVFIRARATVLAAGGLDGPGR